MIKTTIVHIVKHKCGNISERNNYRPIPLTTLFVWNVYLQVQVYLATRMVTVRTYVSMY